MLSFIGGVARADSKARNDAILVILAFHASFSDIPSMWCYDCRDLPDQLTVTNKAADRVF